MSGTHCLVCIKLLGCFHMNIHSITGKKYSVPLKQPFSYFNTTLTHLPYLLISIISDNGIIGIGEGALAWDINGETQEGALACLRILQPLCVDKKIETVEDAIGIMDTISLVLHGNTGLKCGIESALLDSVGQFKKTPICALLGGEQNVSIMLQKTFSYEEVSADIQSYTQSAYDAGVRIFKFKVGNNTRAEHAAIKIVRRSYPDATITIDANQAWKTTSDALAFLSPISNQNIEWIEQPLHAHDYEGLAALRMQCGIPIMADESCHALLDIRLLHAMKAADIMNMKLGKCGGLFELKKMISFCNQNGIRYALGDMIHSSFGTAYNLHASMLGVFITHDLTLPDRIEHDCGEGLHFDKWRVYIPQKPGLGVTYSHSSPCPYIS